MPPTMPVFEKSNEFVIRQGGKFSKKKNKNKKNTTKRNKH